MKQTKKLTRRQREFLESLGVENIDKLRLCKDTNEKLICLNTVDNSILEFSK